MFESWPLAGNLGVFAAAAALVWFAGTRIAGYADTIAGKTGLGREVGATMVRHPAVDMISFTGSTAVGKMTMAAAAESLKRVSMELGGKNPQLVFADADLEAALDAVLFGVYFNAGECCNSGSRLLVQREIAETFVGEVVARSREVPVGDPLDERTKVGAIVSLEHLGKIEGFVAGISRRIDDKIEEIGTDRAELRWDENGIRYRIVLRKEDDEWRIDDVHIRVAPEEDDETGEPDEDSLDAPR